MAPFQPLKKATNMMPRGPAPHLPEPAYGKLKAAPGAQSNGLNGDVPPATAPICPSNVYFQPAYAPVHLQQPPIPVAAPTVPSVTNVLNQVVNLLNQYLIFPPFQPGNGYTPPSFASYPPGQIGIGSGGSGQLQVLGVPSKAVKNSVATNNGSVTAKGRWLEVDRQSEDVRVENPDDEDQYVIIKRINSLTMRNTGTGEILRWQRTNS